MSTDEFIKQQNEKLNAIVKNNKPLLFAVRSVMALQSNRIFLKGLNKNGSAIGDYGSNEIHINPKNSPKKFTPRGKSGKTKKKNGEPYKTGYFSNWLEYKRAIGKNKNINTVDLKWSNELNRSWANGKVTNPQATKINVHQYVVELSENNINKVERYGVNEIFGISKSEKDAFMKVLQAELTKALK